MQDAAEAKRKKEAEARFHDTWHVKGGCWNAWMKDQRTSENKELWLIYVQVILAVRISKQYLLLRVGKWHIHSQNLIESCLVSDTRDTVNVCWLSWCHGRNGRKRRASHCIGIGTWCTWIKTHPQYPRDACKLLSYLLTSTMFRHSQTPRLEEVSW